MHMIEKDIGSIPKSERLEIIGYLRVRQGYGNTKTGFYYFMKSTEIIVNNFVFKYYIYTLGLSLLSIYYQLNIFFSLQLLDIIKQFEPLKNVIRAVTRNSTQLSLTCILLTICIFISSEFGWFFVMEDFFMDSVWPEPELTCSTTFQCFFTVFSLGPRSSGGIGDTMTKMSYRESNRG